LPSSLFGDKVLKVKKTRGARKTLVEGFLRDSPKAAAQRDRLGYKRRSVITDATWTRRTCAVGLPTGPCVTGSVSTPRRLEGSSPYSLLRQSLPTCMFNDLWS